MEIDTYSIFTIGRDQEVDVCSSAGAPTVKVGQRYRATNANKSVLNTSMGDITITCVAKFWDMLLLDKQICVFKSEGAQKVYLEVNGQPVATDGTTIFAESSVHAHTAFFALFAWCLEFGTVGILDYEHANNILSDFKDKKAVAFADVAILCDNFYYTKIKGVPDYTVQDLVLEEYAIALRSGELVPAFGIEQPESKLGSVPVAEKAPESKTFADLYTPEDCAAGKFITGYAWDEESKKAIPDISLLDGYVPTPEYYKLLNKVVKRVNGKVIPRLNELMEKDGENYDRLKALGEDYINVTLCGKPGTGKSIAVHALAATLQMPVYVINNSQNTDEDEYEGKTKMVNGKPTAVPTDVVKAFKYGGICLLEEINLPQAAVVMGALGQAVEFPFVLKEDGYKTIRRHPLCIFISTMNVGTYGSKMLSQPFASRFKQSLIFKDPEKSTFVNILKTKTGASGNICNWVFNSYEKIVAIIKENPMVDADSILMTLSIRSCIGAIENIQEGYAPKEALYDSIVGKIAETDLLLAQNVADAIDSTFKEPRK